MTLPKRQLYAGSHTCVLMLSAFCVVDNFVAEDVKRRTGNWCCPFQRAHNVC